MKTNYPNLTGLKKQKKICELRLKRITDIWLGENTPHLFIQFESGEVLFVYGHHDRFESWQLGVWNNPNESEHWDVIAVAGNNVAIWSPEL